MWKKLTRWLSPQREPAPGLQRYDPGPNNPFGIRLLDYRSVTGSSVAATADPKIAERFVLLRESNGRELIGAPIPDPVRVSTSLRFPHNGARLEGVVFKADGMEVKWDIYIYDSVFLFARSWTGDLNYRAVARIGAAEIHITEIECPRRDAEIAAAHVYFLIGTHAMGCVLPHRLPANTPDDPETMAMLSFSLFGRLGCFATFEDVTTVPMARPPFP
jgi:hypothetical protein